MKTFGDILREARKLGVGNEKREAWSQAAFARGIGRGIETIGRYENNRLRPPEDVFQKGILTFFSRENPAPDELVLLLELQRAYEEWEAYPGVSYTLFVIGHQRRVQKFPLAQSRTYIVGRSESADIILDDKDKSLSRQHLCLSVSGAQINIEILGTNGAWLNDTRYERNDKIGLNLGDVLFVPGCFIILEISSRDTQSFPNYFDIEDLDIGAGKQRIANYEVSPEPASLPDSDPLYLEPERLRTQRSASELPGPLDGFSNEHRATIEGSHEQTRTKIIAPVQHSNDAETTAAEPLSIETVHWPLSRRGRALFRVPRLMWTEVAELAELRLLAKSELTLSMRAALEGTMVGRGPNTEELVVEPVGSKMRAKLSGDSRYFQICPINTETQFVSEHAIHWNWEIVPLREGRSNLTLVISMIADLKGREFEIDAPAFRESITITVQSWRTRPIRFVRDNWKWMLGSSGLGAALAIYALLAGSGA